MYLHPTYAVTPDREPLVVIDAWMWAREPRADVRNTWKWLERLAGPNSLQHSQ
jgi:hypothetical protein